MARSSTLTGERLGECLSGFAVVLCHLGGMGAWQAPSSRVHIVGLSRVAQTHRRSAINGVSSFLASLQVLPLPLAAIAVVSPPLPHSCHPPTLAKAFPGQTSPLVPANTPQLPPPRPLHVPLRSVPQLPAQRRARLIAPHQPRDTVLRVVSERHAGAHAQPLHRGGVQARRVRHGGPRRRTLACAV